MSRKQPRPHQLEALEQLRDGFRAGRRWQLLVMPTGAGKTVAILEMFRLAVEKGLRCLFLCDRRTLVNQAAGEAREYGLDVGVVMAGVFGDRDAPCQFASKDTLLSRDLLPPADLIAVDEAHRSLAGEYAALLQRYPNAFVVGPTATPARGDGRGFGDLYQGLVCPVQPSELLARGLLVPTRSYAPDQIDKDGNRKRLPSSQMIGDAVKWWKLYADGRTTFAFATRVDHSMALRDEFRAAGISAEHMDAHTPDELRGEIFGRMNDGSLLVLVTVGVAREGVDVPRASCAQLVCSLGSYVAYRQSCGRVQRPFPGKVDAVLIDHAGNVIEHGFPDADVPWTLDTSDQEVIDKRVQRQLEEGKMARPVCCPRCFNLFSGRPECPACGYRLSAQARVKQNKSGLLVEVMRDHTPAQVESFLMREWKRFLWIAFNRGQPCSVAAGMFSGKFKQTPWDAGVGPLPDRSDWHKPVGEVFPEFGRKKETTP